MYTNFEIAIKNIIFNVYSIKYTKLKILEHRRIQIA